MKRAIILLAAVGILMSTSLPSIAETIAVTHAKLLTMGPAGEIAHGVLIIEDGKIARLGSELPVPAGATVIDAQGDVVTPGLVAVNTELGLMEVSSVKQTDDSRTHSAELSAAFDVQFGLNPDSTLLPVARLGGITSAVAMPGFEEGSHEHERNQMFAGQAAMIHLGVDADILLRPKIAIVVELGEAGAEHAGGARGAQITALLGVLDRVRVYRKNKAAFTPEESRELGISRADLKALMPVVDSRLPLVAIVHSAADIRCILKIAHDNRLKLILSGAEEGWRVADEIAAAGVPVLLNPTSNLPSRFEMLGATMENAARLHAAGVRIAISGSDSSHLVREMRYNAGIAVAHGLPYPAALEAITAAPAQIFHVDDRVGSLQAGKDADVVIWSGDPLEPLTQPRTILIRGRIQPLTSRQLQLRDRYMKAAELGS